MILGLAMIWRGSPNVLDREDEQMTKVFRGFLLVFDPKSERREGRRKESQA